MLVICTTRLLEIKGKEQVEAGKGRKKRKQQSTSCRSGVEPALFELFSFAFGPVVFASQRHPTDQNIEETKVLSHPLKLTNQSHSQNS